MRRLLSVIVLLTLLVSFGETKATHIVGGEMYYEYLGNNVYKIKLLVYRDCYNGIPGFDNPAYIAVFDTSNNRIKNIRVSPPPAERIPLDNYDSCTKVLDLCYEVAEYEVIDTFPPIPGGYILAYDRCCWNGTVNNIFDPDNTGLLVVTKIADSVYAQNSSPVFNNRTPLFFCIDRAFKFDHSASDTDGDSLAYELFTPLNSSRQFQSNLAPLKPPYNQLIYQPGFSLSNVFGGTVPLKINEKTGLMTATHGNQLGQYVFGIRVNEYRNGVLIGKSERTYQMNSQACRRFTRARFTNPILQCGDSIVQFDNTSDSSMAYLWQFDDPSSGNNTSTDKEPVHEYTQSGQYNVTLIAYSYQGNECNDTARGKVSLYPELNGDFVMEEEKCNNFVQFYDVTNSPSGTVNNWEWDFGDGKGAIIKDPYHFYNLSDVPKTFVINLKIKNVNGCEDTIQHVYTGVNRKYTINSISATKFKVYPRDDSTFLSVDADSAVSYQWSPEEGLSDPKSASTWASPQEVTQYTVTVKDGRGCSAEDLLDIDVYEYSCGENATYMPNAFSPNGDGENDFLRIRGEEINLLNLKVYNRYGQLVFESSDVKMTREESRGWDGSFNGVLQDPGVYVYSMEVECSNRQRFSKKGNVTLIR